MLNIKNISRVLIIILSFSLLAMINISLLQERMINYLALEDIITSFMFFIGILLMMLLITHLISDKINVIERLKNNKFFHIGIILLFLIPNLFYYIIYFDFNEIVTLIYHILNLFLIIIFLMLNVEIFKNRIISQVN